MIKTGQENTLIYNILLALILVILITQINIPEVSASTTTLTGTVLDETSGEPIPGAKLTILYRRYGRYWRARAWSNYAATTSDIQGRYNIKLDTETEYLILVTHLNPEGEHDYTPHGIYHRSTIEQEEKNIELWKASIIHFEGLAYFIETTAIPETTFRVLEPDSNEILNYGSLNLLYGPSSGSISSHLDLPTNKIYVPSGKNFQIIIQSYISRSGENIQHTLLIDEYKEITLEPEETVEIDLRSYVLPQGIIKLQNETESIEQLIIEKEKEGYFLSVERQQLSKIKQTTNAIISLLEQEHYTEAFTKSRESYLLISDLGNGIRNTLSNASRSVFILISFISLTSTIIAILLYENNTQKIITSLGLFIVLILSLYKLHPGSQVVSAIDFVKISVISLFSVNIIALFIPRFLNRSSSGKDISLVNMTVPIFSIAKRSLRRRKLRFALTLTSLLLLVASFISLTSFTSGYGLSFSKTKETVMKEGIMIRSPDPPPEKAAAPFSGGTGVAGPLPLDESLIQWYNQQDEVIHVIPKFENSPQRQYRESYNPIAYIDRTPIFGITSIDPGKESIVNNLNSAVIEGRYLNEEMNEALISIDLAERLGLKIEDTFIMTSQEKNHELNIVGLLNDDILEKLNDLDGESILPSKIIEWERFELDGPDFVVEAVVPCSSDEVVWVNLMTGENISAIRLQRLNLLLHDNVDLQDFARSTALNRGYRAWASTSTGIYLAELTGYFEGKGLPIVIPWLIVVLNVIVTMMNAYYERRHEVMIYSSIGMNPIHVSSIFLAEATVIGIIGGCLGYLLGLGAYKLIYILTPTLQVKQKVSAFWSIAAIGISMMAVIVGGLSALRSSTSITPSLRRRWTIEKKQEDSIETRIIIPVQVYEEEISDYIDFFNNKLQEAKKGRKMMVRMPKLTQIDEKIWEYWYIYSSTNSQISALYSRNRVVVEKIEGKTYSTILYTVGDSESIKQAGAFIRQIGLDWSLQREERTH